MLDFATSTMFITHYTYPFGKLLWFGKRCNCKILLLSVSE